MAEDLIASLTKNALKSRSGLYRWLHENHATLAPAMSVPRPPWLALARTAADNGQSNNGAPYSRQAVRETWMRVERDIAAAADRQQPTAAAPKVSRAQAQPPPPRPPGVPDSGTSQADAGLADVFADWDAKRPKMPEPFKK